MNNKQYYLKVDTEAYNKIKEFCNENNIDLREDTDVFSFLSEDIVSVIEEEDNIELKKLFSKDEKYEYEYDFMCNHIEDTVIKVLDENFKDLKESFYNRLELRGIYKKENK